MEFGANSRPIHHRQLYLREIDLSTRLHQYRVACHLSIPSPTSPHARRDKTALPGGCHHDIPHRPRAKKQQQAILILTTVTNSRTTYLPPFSSRSLSDRAHDLQPSVPRYRQVPQTPTLTPTPVEREYGRSADGPCRIRHRHTQTLRVRARRVHRDRSKAQNLDRCRSTIRYMPDHKTSSIDEHAVHVDVPQKDGDPAGRETGQFSGQSTRQGACHFANLRLISFLFFLLKSVCSSRHSFYSMFFLRPSDPVVGQPWGLAKRLGYRHSHWLFASVPPSAPFSPGSVARPGSARVLWMLIGDLSISNRPPLAASTNGPCVSGQSRRPRPLLNDDGCGTLRGTWPSTQHTVTPSLERGACASDDDRRPSPPTLQSGQSRRVPPRRRPP